MWAITQDNEFVSHHCKYLAFSTSNVILASHLAFYVTMYISDETDCVTGV